jgi:hypothetical protein
VWDGGFSIRAGGKEVSLKRAMLVPMPHPELRHIYWRAIAAVGQGAIRVALRLYNRGNHPSTDDYQYDEDGGSESVDQHATIVIVFGRRLVF